MRIIPAIDLLGGQCVRLYKGDFEKTTVYSDTPATLVRSYVDFGTADLHVVDLDGARSGNQINEAVIRQIVGETSLAVQLGGGIRDEATLNRWFEAGVSRCVIGSLSVTEPDTVNAWLRSYGGDRLVLALDVVVDDQGQAMLTTHGWTRTSELSLAAGIESYLAAGLTHVLCTDVSRDGAMQGPNTDLYQQVLAQFPDLQLQASGGVRDIADLTTLRDAGLPAAITGRAILDGRIQPEEVRSFRHDA